MIPRAAWLGLVAVCLAPAGHAAPPYPSVLPPEDVALRAIAVLPALHAASADVRAEQAGARRLDAGPHEWTLRYGQLRRRESDPSLRTRDSDYAVERGVRWPWKAAQDRRLGQLGIETAQLARGDAWHGAARGLLDDWFAWLRAVQALQRVEAQVAQWERLLRETGRREALGDAARLDVLRVDAEAARLRSQAIDARAERERALATLQARYPALPSGLSAPSELPPQLPADTDWVAQMLAHSHERLLMTKQAEQAQARVDRARAERLPDPTVALVYNNERDGRDRLLGLQVSIPLPGEARRAAGDQAAAQWQAARARADATELEVRGEAQRRLIRAQLARQAAQQQQLAGSRAAETAALVERAWGLGEASSAELIQAQRSQVDAAMAADAALLDAWEAYCAVLVDAHAVWAEDDALAEAAGAE